MKGIQIGLHWLEYTVWNEPVHKTLQHLEFFADNNFGIVNANKYGYTRSYMGRAGITVLSHPDLAHHHVIIPGRWLAEVGENSLILLLTVHCNRYHISRMDIACDNLDVDPTPRDIRNRIEAGELVSYMKNRRSLEDHRDHAVTYYIGSMKSERYLRIYDKTKESHGRVIATRWEIVLRNEYANQAAEYIQNIGLNESFQRTLLSMVDFRKPSKSKERASRRPRMRWYQDFITTTIKAEYSIYEPTVTLERMEHWLQKQVAGTFATVVHNHPDDWQQWVEDLIVRGSTKLRL